MDKSALAIIQTQFEYCAKNLKSHQFDVDIFDTKEEVLSYLKENVQNVSVSVGGSVTLSECGILAWLQTAENIDYIDRYNTSDVNGALHDALRADVYLMSSNAITMDGQLYNVDGMGNRIAALSFGPNKVYVIAGYNKLVNDLQDAEKRVENVAAPMNACRLDKKTPCVDVGHCMHCNRETRICSSFVTTARSHVPGRIHVLLVKESMGY